MSLVYALLALGSVVWLAASVEAERYIQIPPALLATLASIALLVIRVGFERKTGR